MEDSSTSSALRMQFEKQIGTDIAKKFTNLDMDRFLTVNKGDVSKAVAQARGYIEWYEKRLNIDGNLLEFSPSTILTLPDPNEHVYCEFVANVNIGFSRSGFPIYWEKTGLVSCNLAKMLKQISIDTMVMRHIRQQEYVVKKRLIDANNRCRQEPPPDAIPTTTTPTLTPTPIYQQVLVFDLKGISYSPNPDAIVAFSKTLKLDELYYPERMEICIMINVPIFFAATWAIITQFLDAATAKK